MCQCAVKIVDDGNCDGNVVEGMLLDGECLFEMSHQMATNVMNFRPLLQYEYYSQHDKCGGQYAHPAHETMGLSTAETERENTPPGGKQNKTDEICQQT